MGGKLLFRDVNLQFSEGDRVGLCGPNGSGKTTLLRLISGQQEVDGGAVQRKQGLRIGYLPQELDHRGSGGLLAYVVGSVPGRSDLLRDEQRLAAESAMLEAQPHPDEALLLELSERMALLHERIHHFETFFADHVALRILMGLGFRASDKDRDLTEFSGGWRMRAVLATMLFQQPDLLLLDEPTNHLDLPSAAWFASFLKRYNRALILVSHDREFLNEQITRVVSFEPEGLRSYQGNYESYRRQRDEERVVLEARARNLQREREKAEEFIARYRAKARKASAVQSKIKALERQERIEVLSDHDAVNLKFVSAGRTSKVVLQATGLTKRYGDNTVFSGIDLGVTAGEKIGVIGQNGAGKTTLLKILAGELVPEAGTVAFGQHVKRGYFAQHQSEALNPDATILEEVMYSGTELLPLQLRTLLGALLFSGDDVEKPVRVLSGGERSRVALAKILASPSNLLLMDEPTTHLDLMASERLAEALSTFDGTLIFVSHNRSFIRTLATRIWNVADGLVETYPGTLDEYMESAVRRLDMPEEAPGKPRPAPNAGTSQNDDAQSGKPINPKERKRRDAALRNRRREALLPYTDAVKSWEQRITALEASVREHEARLADPLIYQDPAASAEENRLFKADAQALEEANAQWESAALLLEEHTAQFEAENAQEIALLREGE
jgi:ATP-binding cassette subfamily F protein 3